LKIPRRDLLKGTGIAFAQSALRRAGLIAGALPWEPDTENSPSIVKPQGWLFFTDAEAQAVEALVDRIIPPDPQTPGGRDAGCAVFIDRQLDGPYGRSEGLYTAPPYPPSNRQQGPQSPQTPQTVYRQGLAGLDRYCRARSGGQPFARLDGGGQDALLHGLEDGSVQLEGADGKIFFTTCVKDAQMGFFADPIYGGNRDMCAWKMIGFPGARYDYREWVGRHNERYPHPPVSIGGRADWTPRKT
jgi:gluconate 2-dehydrogenase gamma chain